MEHKIQEHANEELGEQNGEGDNDGGKPNCISTMVENVRHFYVRYVGPWPF